MKRDKRFVHLHVHSDYSLLDGAASIEGLVDAARRYGMESLALTDHGNMFAAINFYQKASKAGIKPIIGYEAYLATGSRKEREGGQHHLTLLAANYEGYKNLLKLATAAYLEGFYYKPRIDKEILARHSKGLIALSGCLKGETASLILHGDFEAAVRTAGEFSEIFGKDNFFLEVMVNALPEQSEANKGLLEIASRTGIGVVATNDVHYIEKEDARVQDVLLCIGTGKVLSDEKRMRFGSDEFYFRSPAEMVHLFRDIPEAIRNTTEIAARCNVKIPLGEEHFPRFHSGRDIPNDQLLRELCEEGLKRCYPEGDEEARKRMEIEFEVIKSMGFVNYMLLVWDFVRYAKENGIPVGPGRGSAVGSIICYLLDITEVDPLKYNLLFERFLNKDRISPPDIDIDFCKEKREEVLNYVRNKYGRENVAQIITFGTLGSRAAVRDVGRVLGLPYADVDRMAKLIPTGVSSLKEAIESTPELKDLYETNDTARELFDISMKVEGLVRHSSTHAAGVVVADAPLVEYVPLYKPSEKGNGESNGVSTQYDMKSIAELGLFKMDFLGLKTLTIIEKAVEIIERTTGKRLDVKRIPIDDTETFDLLSRGQTRGVFQVESQGFTSLLKRLKPGRIEDLIAALAVYRPGPLGSGMVDEFVKCKHDPSCIRYPHPLLEDVLKETYGIPVYQEQVMQIANVLAGFSMTEADLLRRAMAKKIPEEMEKYRDRFVEGAVKKGVERETAERIFEQISYFAGYGFNKSHATAYAMIAYRTAYLKAHYPTEYMAALLTYEMNDTSKLIEYLDECKSLGIEVLPPDVNESYEGFTVIGPKKIRFGLGAVKRVGGKAIASIVKARKTGGRFRDLVDFCERVDTRLVNRQVIESLIKAGAFSSIGAKRAQLMEVLDEAMHIAEKRRKDFLRGQTSLFASLEEAGEMEVPTIEMPDVEEWAEPVLLAHEKAALGLYVTNHPLARYEKFLKTYTTATSRELAEVGDGRSVVIGGMVVGVRKLVTKKGETMAYVDVEDLDGITSVVVFPDLYKNVRELLTEDQLLVVGGRVDIRDERISVRASLINLLEKAPQEFVKRVEIDIEAGEDPEHLRSLLYEIRDVLSSHPGTCTVFANVKCKGTVVQVQIDSRYHVTPSEALLEELQRIAGPNHVRFVVAHGR